MTSLFSTRAALVVLAYAYAVAAAQGFTLTMKHTVLSAPNLTRIHKHHLLLHASNKSRFSAPLSRAVSPFFYVEVGIGSPPVNVKLVFDTGSATTWTQCAGCKVCFPVAIPAFDPRLSSTYRRIPANHTLCDGELRKPPGKFCGFEILYVDGELIKGDLSFETFTFGDSKMKVPGFAFGCGLYDKNVRDFSNDANNPISGVFGIGKDDPISILHQLRSVTKLKFSYCLPLRIYEESNHHAFLHFGKEAEFKSQEVLVQTTPLLGFPGDNSYYAKLNGIRVNGSFLPIDPKLMMTDGLGVIVDSGTPYTLFVDEGYNHLREAIVKYFVKKYGWKALRRSMSGFDLCYSMVHQQTIGDIEFPKIEFHFEGAVMELIRDAVFQVFNQDINQFCLMIQPHRFDNVLGAFQMVNQSSCLTLVPQNYLLYQIAVKPNMIYQIGS